MLQKGGKGKKKRDTLCPRASDSSDRVGLAYLQHERKERENRWPATLVSFEREEEGGGGRSGPSRLASRGKKTNAYSPCADAFHEGEKKRLAIDRFVERERKGRKKERQETTHNNDDEEKERKKMEVSLSVTTPGSSMTSGKKKKE